MLCLHCKKEIVLTPSANERSKRYGETPQYYTAIFKYHSDCQLKMRSESVLELIRNKQ